MNTVSYIKIGDNEVYNAKNCEKFSDNVYYQSSRSRRLEINDKGEVLTFCTSSNDMTVLGQLVEIV